MATMWTCPCCEMVVAAGATHICPVQDARRDDPEHDPGWHLTPSQKYRLLRSLIQESRRETPAPASLHPAQ